MLSRRRVYPKAGKNDPAAHTLRAVILLKAAFRAVHTLKIVFSGAVLQEIIASLRRELGGMGLLHAEPAWYDCFHLELAGHQFVNYR